MANKRIKDLPEKLSVSNDDFFVLEDSVDSYKTKKVKGSNIGGSSDNFATADLTFTANRTHNANSNSLEINSLSSILLRTQTTLNEIYADETQTYLWSKGSVDGTYTGIYTDTKGIQAVENSTFNFSNKITIYADSGGIFLKRGLANYLPIDLGAGISILSDSFIDLSGDNGVRVISPGATAGDTAFTVRNNTDTGYLTHKKGNGDYFEYHSVAGYSMGYSDLGNSFPEFVLDCASGGQSRFHMRNNGTDAMVSYTIGTNLWEQYREWQVRSIVTNNIHMIRDIEGRWLFSNDATGTDTPASDTRMKIAADGLNIALSTDAGVKMENLQTYADNATAVGAIGTNRLYIRTGHGLDITV